MTDLKNEIPTEDLENVTGISIQAANPKAVDFATLASSRNQGEKDSFSR